MSNGKKQKRVWEKLIREMRAMTRYSICKDVVRAIDNIMVEP